MSAAAERLEDAVADLLAEAMTRDTTPAEAMVIVASAVARTLVAYGNVQATRDQRPEDVAATLRDVADQFTTAERDARYLVRLHRGRYRALWRTDPSTDTGKVTP